MSQYGAVNGVQIANALNQRDQRRRRPQRQLGVAPMAPDDMQQQPVQQLTTAPAPAPAPTNTPAVRRPQQPGMMGPPTAEGSRVQGAAQDFRVRRAQQDEALIARGIDPAAAREQMFLNRQPSTRELVLRAATLRARGQTAAADRLIEQSRGTRMDERAEGVDRMALRNPERAGSSPAIDRIARQQSMQRTEQATQDVEFGAFQNARQSMARTGETLARTGEIDATTGERIAGTTQEGRVGLAGDQIAADRSDAQTRLAQNESRQRLLSATTDMSVEEIGQNLEVLKQRAPIDIQTQMTAAQAQLEGARTTLERETAMRTIRGLVNQVEIDTAEDSARAQAGAAQAGLQAQTAIANQTTAQANEEMERINQLGPAERAAALAELEARKVNTERNQRISGQAEDADVDTVALAAEEQLQSNMIRRTKLERKARYINAGFDPDDQREVDMADLLIGSKGEQYLENAKRDRNGARQIGELTNAAQWLRSSDMTREKKAEIAKKLLTKVPKGELTNLVAQATGTRVSLRRILTPMAVNPAGALGTIEAIQYADAVRGLRTVLQDMAN